MNGNIKSKITSGLPPQMCYTGFRRVGKGTLQSALGHRLRALFFLPHLAASQVPLRGCHPERSDEGTYAFPSLAIKQRKCINLCARDARVAQPGVPSAPAVGVLGWRRPRRCSSEFVIPSAARNLLFFNSH